MTWIKICGTTNLDDALLAYEAGADALGFVFAESKRRVTAEQVAAITCGLPEDVERVGVFNNHTLPAIVKTVEQAQLTRVQLHGHGDWQIAQRVADEAGVKVACVLHIVGEGLPDEIIRHHLPGDATNVDAILFDTAVHGRMSGGTGVSWDWKRFTPLVDEFSRVRKVIVAGGLTPENVAEAMDALHPWGVDVVTGVEREPGKKDPQKLKAFIGAVRRADEENEWQ